MNFLRTTNELIQMFSGEQVLSYEQGKYFNDPDFPGCKAIEAFDGDILNNLVEWASADNAVFYRTEKYWYIYEVVEERGCPIIKCTRFDKMTNRRWDTWMNVHSCSVGKDFLQKHRDKQIQLI